MKKFIAVFTGNPDSLDKYQQRFPNEAARKANDQKGMEAWMKWGKEYQAVTVDMGAPLGRTKRITKDGIADVRNNMAGYTIVHAESQEAAARMFLNHPHFTIFPGDSVEIMEVLPIPGQR